MLFNLVLLLAVAGTTFAQSGNVVGSSSEISKIFIKRFLTLHFLSPEKITYVDIPKGLVGDLPDKNLLRLKISDSLKIRDAFLGILTILGETKIKQYSVIYDDRPESVFSSLINIQPGEMGSLAGKDGTVTESELGSISRSMLESPPLLGDARANKNGIKAVLNGIGTAGDYILLDIGFENFTHLPYEIDRIRFRIEDEKQHKATTVQSIELIPVSILLDIPLFEHRYRNIFVLNRLTFPDHKRLRVELSEKQISGRSVTFDIHYRDILKAKKINK